MLRGKLEKIKASGLDPAWLGGMLRAEGIIGAEDEEKAKDEAVGVAARLEELTTALERNSRKGVVDDLVAVLMKQPSTMWLAKELKGTVFLGGRSHEGVPFSLCMASCS